MRPGDPLQLEEDAVVEAWLQGVTWTKIETRIRRGRRVHRLAIAVTVAAAFLAGLLAAPRSSAVNPAGAWGLPSLDQRTTGAPPSLVETPLPAGAVAGSNPASGSGAPTPHPTGGIGEPATGTNPNLTPEPERTPPATRFVSRGTGIGGQATWWASFGSGLYAAIRPDLGTKGDTAVVCGGEPYHCLTLPIITTCACLGPGSGRLIDLSIDAFRSFADPSAGVVDVVVQVLGR